MPRTPFFIIRFVFFCLLVYLSLGALIFAAWNMGASHAFGVYVLGSSIFLIFNSIMTFILVSL
ncbi:hypothetical protein FA95DRAFT_1614057 [Auriscalpium vulgare]|uniref:Uncharacterized protein n=1 Tax=Auriscalpium vulgare TaxID=40419 RepID=A0ACB8R1V3_9AGAM|nr:hypothetical protein FA95DRAFT_1614057 [Auriscalpium vulgare]